MTVKDIFAENVTNDTWDVEVPQGEHWDVRGIEVHDVPTADCQFHVEYQRFQAGGWWPWAYSASGYTCPALSLGRFAFVPGVRVLGYTLLSGFGTVMAVSGLPNTLLEYGDRIRIVRDHVGVPPVGAMSIYICVQRLNT